MVGVSVASNVDMADKKDCAAMTANARKTGFLQALQQRIERYKPVLEDDVYMSDIYPADAQVQTEFSEFRKEGKQLVTELVGQHGTDILKSVPSQWSEFDSKLTHSRAS
jgi:hypothetical protein